MKTRELHIVPDSEAERYFCNELLAVTKDSKSVRLGEIWGVPYNTYIISEDDFMRIRDYIHKKQS